MNTMLEKRKGLLKNKKGFTLIELIVVIVIIGILAAVLIPRMTGFTDKAKGTEALVHAKQVATAIDSILAENSTLSKSTVSELSKVSEAAITSLSTTGTSIGAFLVDIDGHEAGRDSAEGKVEMK